MSFKQVTDRLMAEGVSLREVAEALGVAHNTVRMARLASTSSSWRKPPAGWEAKLAGFARSRSTRLAKLADQLERRG